MRPRGLPLVTTRAGDAASRPLRILMVAARYLPFSGGTEMHVHETATRMAQAGHRVTVLTADPGSRLPPAEEAGGVRVVRLPSWPTGRDYHLAPSLPGWIRRTEWDIAHIQGYHTFFAPLAMMALIGRRIPFVVTFHSGGHSSGWRRALRPVQHALLGPLVARAARAIGVSRFEAELFGRRLGLAPERVCVVPNGARLPTPSAPARRDAARPLVLSLGRLERYKGHQRAIAAFPSLLARRPGARLRILGQGPYEAELRALVGRLGLAGSVEIGSIPASDRTGMADAVAAASLVVLLSDYEAHPVSVMEALSLGTPVLTGDTSGFRELAERGLVRALPLSSEPEAVADAMETAIDGGAPVLAEPLPDWDACTQRLLAIYRDVLASAPAEECRPVPASRPAAEQPG